MTRHKTAIGAVALGFTLSAATAWAGQRPSDSSAPRGGSAGAAAESRVSGGSGGSTSSGGSGSVGGSSSSSSGSSGTAGGFAPSPSRPEVAVERAPQHPRAQERGGAVRPRSGDAPTGHAVPRGTAPSGDASISTGGDQGHVTSPRERAVPRYSRPREGRPVTGHAAERTTPIPDRRGRDVYYYSPYPFGYYYDPFGFYGSYWYPSYSLGLGYFYYDPYWYGSYGGYQGHGSGRYAYYESGSLRLKIKPRDAQVLVDGYFVGNIDSFDGIFQRLKIEAGAHKIEIRAPGYAPLQFDVLLAPGETVTYKGELEPIR